MPATAPQEVDIVMWSRILDYKGYHLKPHMESQVYRGTYTAKFE